MGIIGEKLPIKSLLEGEEKNAIGNQSLDRETLNRYLELIIMMKFKKVFL